MKKPLKLTVNFKFLLILLFFAFSGHQTYAQGFYSSPQRGAQCVYDWLNQGYWCDRGGNPTRSSSSNCYNPCDSVTDPNVRALLRPDQCQQICTGGGGQPAQTYQPPQETAAQAAQRRAQEAARAAERRAREAEQRRQEIARAQRELEDLRKQIEDMQGPSAEELAQAERDAEEHLQQTLDGIAVRQMADINQLDDETYSNLDEISPSRYLEAAAEIGAQSTHNNPTPLFNGTENRDFRTVAPYSPPQNPAQQNQQSQQDDGVYPGADYYGGAYPDASQRADPCEFDSGLSIGCGGSNSNSTTQNAQQPNLYAPPAQPNNYSHIQDWLSGENYPNPGTATLNANAVDIEIARTEARKSTVGQLVDAALDWNDQRINNAKNNETEPTYSIDPTSVQEQPQEVDECSGFIGRLKCRFSGEDLRQQAERQFEGLVD